MRDLIDLRHVRRLYNIWDVLHLNARKTKIVCPLPQHVHHNRTPSFSIFISHESNVQKWKCHGNCSLQGDILDLIGFMHIAGYDPKNGTDVKRAVALLTGNTPINPPRAETVKVPALPNGKYKVYLPAGEEVRKYAMQRSSLTSETLERFFIGQYFSGRSTWMTMPTLHGNQLRGIKMRNVNACDRFDRFMAEPGSVAGLFNYNQVDSTGEPVAIVKGEIAVMVLFQYGIQACAPTGGELSYNNHEELLRPITFSRRRIVIGDNDVDPDVRAKIVAAAERRKELFRAEKLYLPPDPYVGVDDWVLAQPEVAVPMIKSWMGV